MAPRRFDIPLNYNLQMGNNPKKWINKVMARKTRVSQRPVGILTIPYPIRKVLSKTLMMTDDDEKIPEPCIDTEKDIWFPDPVKMAECLISKPTIRQMGQEEEKIYCGMIYGPEYTDYEHKARKRVAKSIRKLLIKHLPLMQEKMENQKEENKIQIRQDFKMWLQNGKKAIMKEKEEELKQLEVDLKNRIQLERRKALMAVKGRMEEEIKAVNEAKKEYLKEVFEFQMNWFLKDHEQLYIDRMNLYSTIWNKILRNLSERAKRKISELNCSANQTINTASVQAIIDIEDYNHNLTVNQFQDKVEKTMKEIKSKVLAEELHILQEKKRGQKIQILVDAWNSLLEHIIMLFDKVVVFGFQGKPGECNYFLDRNIMNKFKHSLEAEESATIKSSDDKISEMEKSVDKSQALSHDKSFFTVDMTVDPPDKDRIIQLHLFKVKKLIEETTCVALTKPLQISPYMKDRSAELKSFSSGSQEDSSYILDKLSDAYTLIEKMLYKSDVENLGPVVHKEVPYTIETDPELTNRINSLIKCYRSNPDNMRALTNV